MSCAIVGFGNIGQALARAFARNGIEVSVATTRDPESFARTWSSSADEHDVLIGKGHDARSDRARSDRSETEKFP